MKPFKFILAYLIKSSRQSKSSSGFTLIELLVAMIIAVLIITPMLTLVINLMDSDRKEQAKSTSQQEIQAALDYIAQDLKQAVYIYDATGLNTNSAPTPAVSGIKDQIPPVASTSGCNNTNNCVPVLAFWKRRYFDKNDTIGGVSIKTLNDSSQGSDRFVYSLVVYYLIKDGDSTWSNVARIGRFELRDGITNSINPATPIVLLPANPRFQKPPDYRSGQLSAAMNRWQKETGNYDPNVNPVVTLIDFVDDTTLAGLPSDVANKFTPPANDVNTAGVLTSTLCSQTDKTGVGSSRVPPAPPTTLNTGSFYACVNPVNENGQSVAQVYLRGNALARLRSDPNTWAIDNNNKDQQLLYRPTASVRVAARGFLGK